ncbi:MAG: 4-hydroxybenzoate octaprenyltransferase, partial [Leptolyngbyaceae cyanobacterium]
AAEAVLAFFVATTVLLAKVGMVLDLTLWYWLGLGGAIALWLWQYWRLRTKKLPRPVFGQIFSQNVLIGFILLGGMIAGAQL